jgi:hypothetical protein
MSSRDVFSPNELAELRGFPEIGREELIRFFTLTSAEATFLRANRSPTIMLGVAVQLCTLPWLGFVPDEVTAAPPAAVQRLASKLGIAAEALVGYGEREQTRTDHLREVLTYLNWRTPDFAVASASGTQRIAELARAGRPVLVDLTESGGVAVAVTDTADHSPSPPDGWSVRRLPRRCWCVPTVTWPGRRRKARSAQTNCANCVARSRSGSGSDRCSTQHSIARTARCRTEET